MPRKITSRLLNTEAASALLRCSPAALAKFRTERRGPPYVRVGRLIRYRHRDLLRWINSQRVSPEQSPRNHKGQA
jgi:Helix-turn-helix domain